MQGSDTLMAKFDMQLPDELIQEFESIGENTEKIFGEMTKAGAEVVMENLKANVPTSFVGSDIMNCLKMTKTYKTPTDGGINTKVAFYGYFTNKNGKKVPAPLVANVFEYGKSGFIKQPFLRSAFREDQIEKAMLEAQKKASGGLLDDE